NRLAALRNSIFDRILDDRLKKERGKPCLIQLLWNFDFDVQPIGKARGLDIEIQPLQVDLFSQSDVGTRVERKAGTEEGGKRQQHRLGAVASAGHHQRGKRVQRVEQEMGVDLVAQRLKLRRLR